MITQTENTKALFALHKAGISKTSKRLAVLNILLKATKPLSATTIRQALKEKVNIDKVTVYRILSVFCERGIIREIASAGDVSYFEMASREKHQHPHFSCRTCGALTCMPPQPSIKISDFISAKENCSIEHIEINVSGICSSCHDTVKPKPQKRNNNGE